MGKASPYTYAKLEQDFTTEKTRTFLLYPEDTKNAVGVRIKYTVDTKQYQTAAINQVLH